MPPAHDLDRRLARSFGAVADDYDRARPTYPPDAVRWLLRSGPLDVVDLGAGTGKLTAVLVDAGHRVVAVEPLEQLRAKLAAALLHVRVLEGSAEDIPLDDGCADAVVVGQAFHWFDTRAAVAEIARVLRPGGTLGLLWNFRDDEQPWMRELAAIAGEDGLSEGWGDELGALPAVAAVERRDFRLEPRVDRDTLVALVSSWSDVATLDEPARQELLGRIGDLWDTHPQLAGATEASVVYRTEASRVRVT